MRAGQGGAFPREPPDLRLAAPAAAAWLLALVLLGQGVHVAVWATVGGIAAIILARSLLPPTARWRWSASATLVCATAAAACCAFHLAVLHSGPLSRWAAAGADVRAELVVSGDPVRGERPTATWQDRTVSVRATLRRVVRPGAGHVGRQPVLVIASGRAWGALTPGQRVIAEGSLDVPRDEGVLAAVLHARSPPRLVGRPQAVQRVAGSLRAGLREAVSGQPVDERGLIPGLVVGDTSRLPDRLDHEFKETGLTHLLAVSGANLAIVTGLVVGLGRRMVLPPRLVACVAAGGIVGFVVLARPEPSVLRAAVMGGIGLLALASGRPKHALPALFVAVLVLIYADPTMAKSFGFALSVLATFGLLVLAPPWRDRLEGRGVPRPLAEAIAVPAAAQVMCAPVIVLLAGQVNLVAIPANLLAAPAVPIVTVLGVVVTIVQPFAPAVATLLGWCASLPTWWLVQVARAGAALPWASVDWPGGVVGALALAVLTVAVFVVARRRLARALMGMTTAVVLVVVVALHLVAPSWPPKGWQLVACDVGQGDGLVLRVTGRTAVVIDTGPDPTPMRACLDRLGVRQVPLLFLTHLHADHVGGVEGVLRSRDVESVVTTPLHRPPEQWQQLRAAADREDVPIRHATAGTSWRSGDLTLQVLWPRSGQQVASEGESAAANDASLVIRAERPGFAALLTGDIEPPAQEELRAGDPDLEADVLKVPHHGSAHQDAAFLDAVDARVGLISVGADNGYGHPAGRTLHALRYDNMRVLRTDRRGDVAVLSTSSGDLAVAVRGAEDDS